MEILECDMRVTPQAPAVTGPVVSRGLGERAEFIPGPKCDFAGRRIHFMGAGGIGVSALMELCLSRGAIVTGCDCSSGGQVPALRERGIRVETKHCPSHIADCDELVHTAAVDETHPEVQQAKLTGKTISSRMHMLGRIAQGTRAVGITGAHGKTTTTWLIANMLIQAGRDPSVLLGGTVKAMNGNVRIGQGQEFVAEVDESDNRLSEIIPSIPVLTNIDNDHLEHYGSIEAIEEAALNFMSSLDSRDPLSVLVGCGDDKRVRNVLSKASSATRRPVLAYGLTRNCDVCAMNVRSAGLEQVFDVLGPFGMWQDIFLPMPGIHNVVNSLAAISTGWHMGISEPVIRRSLAMVERVGRRFEIKGVARGVRVIDDYGHHPVEIKATLKAVRASTEKRLCVLFQPHRYTRTEALMQDFAGCFGAADRVILLPIYAASEPPIPGIDHHALAKAVAKHGVDVVAAENRADAVSIALSWAASGDTLVTQGAGDITRAADDLVSRL